MRATLFALVACLACCGVTAAQDSKSLADEKKVVEVPYRLTNTQHILVRCKINGKGPFNLVVDTGCPVLLIVPKVGKLANVKADEKGKTTLDSFELEGGLDMGKTPAIVTMPFQIDGMNALGLPGVELHGLIGYTVLAKNRIGYDFTRRKLKVEPLDFNPPAPQPLGKKVDVGGGLDMMAGMLKVLAALSGIKPAPPPEARGFLGVDVDAADGDVVVKALVAGGPAEKAGVRVGDKVRQFNGKALAKADDFTKAAHTTPVDRSIKLTIERAGQTQEISITAISGI